MTNKINKVAKNLDLKLNGLRDKTAAKKSKSVTMSRKQLEKIIGKLRGEYLKLKRECVQLAKEKESLDTKLSDARDAMKKARTEMLNKQKALQNLDLTDSNKAVFYDNEAQDVGYISDGVEYDVGTDEDGDTTLIKRIKNKKPKTVPKKDPPDDDAPPPDDACEDVNLADDFSGMFFRE